MIEGTMCDYLSTLEGFKLSNYVAVNSKTRFIKINLQGCNTFNRPRSGR